MAAGRIVLSQYFPARDRNGRLVAGAKLYVYLNETTTKASIYSNEAMTTALANPVEANSSGQFPAIWASDATTYTLSITGPDGESIGNPSVFDDYSVSTGAETESVALAEAAATAAEAAYADALAISASGDDAAAIAARAAKAQNGADFADVLAVTENIQTKQDDAAATARTQRDKNNDVLNAADFLEGVTGADTKAKLQAALANAILTGRELILPPGTYQADGLSAVIDTYLSYAASFGAGVRIRGSGEGVTILDNREANGFLFDLSTDTAYKFIQGGYITDLTIMVDDAVTVANSGGIQINRTTDFLLARINIVGLSGTGLKFTCAAGDADGNVRVRTERVRIEGCAVWGWDGAAGTGYNENSFLSTTDVTVQNCGTAEETAITGITQANPAVVTSANHGRSNGDIVYIAGVQGMAEVNTGTSGIAYKVAGATTNTFQLTNPLDDSTINSTGYTAYSSGGHVISARPESGGVRWKGQISKHDNLSLTINENVSLYVEPGPATAQGLDLSGVVIENPKMVGAIIGGVTMLRSSMGQSYVNATQAGKQCYFGWMIDGTSVANQHVYIEKHTVRATSADPDYVQWAMCGSLNVVSTIRVRETAWLAFGYSRQKRFTSQWRFDFDFSENIVCLASSTTTAVVTTSATIGKGGNVPIRLRYSTGGDSSDGEWVTRRIETVTITKPGSDGVYNIYLYDNANVVTAETSSTDPVLDTASGLMVKTGDATRTFVGRLAVSGGSWVTSGGGYLGAIPFGGAQPGTRGNLWVNESDRSISIKLGVTAPSSSVDRNYTLKATFEASKTVDLGSIAAGASTTFTMDGTNGVVGLVGDKVIGVSASGYSGGLMLSGEFSADSTITVTAFNPTASAIDMASATFYVEYQRR